MVIFEAAGGLMGEISVGSAETIRTNVNPAPGNPCLAKARLDPFDANKRPSRSNSPSANAFSRLVQDTCLRLPLLPSLPGAAIWNSVPSASVVYIGKLLGESPILLLRN